jgi:hypothetical protein
MLPILKWQYDQLVKELLLLQEHSADKSCQCETGGEMCVRKHLLTIEAYAQETLSIEDAQSWRDKLASLALEAKNYREREEKAICDDSKTTPYQELLEWSRKWRKEFETYSLACEVK